MPAIPDLTVRLTHSGFYTDGRPNPSGILIEDIDVGADQQFRKSSVYIPSGGTIDLPLTNKVLYSFLQGDIHGFIESGQLSWILPAGLIGEVAPSWSFTTADTGIDYFGGFYQFGPTDNDFSPSITFGSANQARAAHFFVVTGAVPVDTVTITVTGNSVTDAGVRIVGDAVTITIPAGTPVNSYFETPEKWNGQVGVETTGGTAITCNYGMAKYYDHNNRDFDLVGFECIWTSESADSVSDIRLIHHRTTDWTFNPGAEPDHPPHIFSRATDFGTDVAHVIGETGAWKRAGISRHISGGDTEGIIWEVVSGSSGIGSQSFRTLNANLTLRVCLLGVGFCPQISG